MRSAVLFTLLLAACTADPRAASWQVRLGDGVVERSLVVVVMITEDACPPTGLALYREEVRFGVDAPAPPALSPGTYCFAARAQDDACVWFATGEETVELPLPTGDPVEIHVDIVAMPEAACAPDECQEGICESADAGAPDAGPPVEGDAGPPPDDAGPPGDDASVDAEAGVDAGPAPTMCGSSTCTPTQACIEGACLETCRADYFDPICPAGSSCFQGVCWESCGAGDTCPGSLTCDPDGFCRLQTTCMPGAPDTCPPGFECNISLLFIGSCWLACISDTDCPGSLSCRAGIFGGGGYCAPRCGSASDCPSGAECYMPLGHETPMRGTCYWPCTTVTDCPSMAPITWACTGGICLSS